jgi:hypothetical protein
VSLGALIFSDRLGVITARLVQIFLGCRSDLELAFPPLQVLARQGFGIRSLVIVIVRLSQIWGIDQRQDLAAFDPIAQGHFEFEHASAQGRKHLGRPCRVRLDHPGQFKSATGKFGLRGTDRETLTERGLFRNQDLVALADHQWRDFIGVVMTE